MIDIVDVISQNVEAWQVDQKCDQCWEFTAPMLAGDLNEYQFKGDGCCVLVAITDFRYNCNPGFNPVTALSQMGSENYDFNLHILVQSEIGLNTYNEIGDHPLSESKWTKHLNPLMECLGCTPLDFCTYLGIPLQVTRWQATPRINWLDMNYDGWTINVQLRNNNVA